MSGDEMPEGVEFGPWRVVAHLRVGGEMQVRTAEAPVAQGSLHVAEARDEPVVGGLVVQRRAGSAQSLVGGVGTATNRGSSGRSQARVDRSDARAVR